MGAASTVQVAVECDAEARKMARCVIAKLDCIDNLEQEWHQDIRHITEDDIAELGRNSIQGISLSSPCGDFSTLRLLPDREGFDPFFVYRIILLRRRSRPCAVPSWQTLRRLSR